MAMSTSETDDSSRHNLLRLRVTAEADPQSLPRVLERFTNLAVTPRRVHAERSSNGVLHIEVDVAGLSEDRMTLITGKVAQATLVLSAYWHRV
jgi:hypothetical protein